MSHGMLWYHVSSSFDNTPLTSICCVSPFMPDFADFVNVALLLGLGGRTGRAATRNLNNFWAGEQRRTNVRQGTSFTLTWPDMARPGLARKELSCHPTAPHDGALSARNTEGEFSEADQIYVTFLRYNMGKPLPRPLHCTSLNSVSHSVGIGSTSFIM